ncbi:MAG: hypothetical protein ACYTGZ_17470 [Planctomycetota bacterium]|jgi:hypothetical protein
MADATGLRPLTFGGVLRCPHPPGSATIPIPAGLTPTDVVTDNDIVGMPIGGCPMPPPAKPCTMIVSVTAGFTGETARGGRVLSEAATGMTDGAPGGPWTVADPGPQ